MQKSGVSFRVRATLCFVLLTVLLFPPAIVARASDVKIDGKIGLNEWSGSNTHVIINSKVDSNCRVNYGNFKYLLDENNYIIYIAARETNEGDEADNLNSGFAVSINGGDYLVATTALTEDYNTDLYYVEAAFKSDYVEGISGEMKIGAKHGWGEYLSVDFRYIDCDGNKSNVYTIVLKEPQPPNETFTTAVTTTNKSTVRATETRTVPIITKGTTQQRTYSEHTNKPIIAGTSVKAVSKYATLAPSKENDEIEISSAKKITFQENTKESKETDSKKRSPSVTPAPETANSTTGEKMTAAAVADSNLALKRRLSAALSIGLIIISVGICVLTAIRNSAGKDS